MPFNRARYVTICQQFLVTATVGAVGLSAAGVMTLQIVAPGAETTDAVAQPPMRSAVHLSDETYVATRPVTPQVREVAVEGVDPEAARDIPGVVEAQEKADDTATRKSSEEPADKQLVALTEPTKVEGYATVGVTWAAGTEIDDEDITVQVRTRTDGEWSEWTDAEYHDEHGPDAGTDEATASVRPGTDAVVVGDVDEVQMKAETADGRTPEDLQLAVVDPGTGAQVEQEPAIDTAGATRTDAGADADEKLAEADLALQAMTPSAQPMIYSRRQWGANESLRDGAPSYGKINAGFIHHTVNANSYTSDQVPSLIRGIYAYHTQSRGWSDIGYNFLVDRFGRIWEGRYGGARRPVIGAHTLGYNAYAFAMSAIGNFDIAQPPQRIIDAYSRLMAWKLSLHDIKAANTKVWVKDRYLHAINGHRDTGSTACPGRYLYARMDDVRVKARQIQLAAQEPVEPAEPTDPVDMPVIGAPAGVPAPTTAPTTMTTQPKINLPRRTSVAGNAWADIVTKSSSGAIRVTPTNGLAGFGARVVNRGPWADMAKITAVGDVTGDGNGDVLARTAGTGYARIFKGDGRGNIASKGIMRTSRFKRASMIIGAGDWNRDGLNDVIARDRVDSGLYLYLGKGGGRFAAPTLMRRNWSYTRTAAVGDFTGDGRIDLMAQRYDNRLILIPGKGGTTEGKALGAPSRLLTMSKPTAFAGWGDFDGDRKADVLYRESGTGLVRVLTGTGTGKVRRTMGPFVGLNGISQVTMAPTARGGPADYVGRDFNGRLVVVPHNNRTNLQPTLPGNLTVGVATLVLSVGDWDRDGKSDVITREYSGNRLVLRRGLGNGKFDRGRSLGNGWKDVTRLAAVGDVTGDGYPDLMGRFGTGRLIIWPGAGLKAFKAPVWAPSQMRTYNQVGTGTWFTSADQNMYTSTNGSFVPAASDEPMIARRYFGGTLGGYDQVVGVGDVNGDNRADMIARAKDTGVLWLLPGKTSGGYGQRVWVGAGFAGYQLIG